MAPRIAVVVLALALTLAPDMAQAQVRLVVGTSGSPVLVTYPLSRPAYAASFVPIVRPTYNYAAPAGYSAYNYAIPYGTAYPYSYATYPYSPYPYLTGGYYPGYYYGVTVGVYGNVHGPVYGGYDEDVPLNPPPRMRPVSYGYLSEAASDRAVLRITVPTATAQLWVDGQPVESFGVSRRYVTPALIGNVSRSYEVRVRWVEDGQVRTQTQTVRAAAGQTVSVHFPR